MRLTNDPRVAELKEAIMTRQYGVIRNLIAAGVDVNAQTTHLFSKAPLLLVAASEGDPEVCEMLLRAGADLHGQNNSEGTPLHAAAAANNVDCCRFLIQRGANLEAKDQTFSYTPLFHAIQWGSGKTCSLLLESGADPAARSHLDVTPLHMAAQYSRIELGQILLDLGVPVDIRARVDNTFVCDSLGCLTPLHAAVEAGSLTLCKLLVAHGADPSYAPKRLFQKDYLSPVQRAIEKKSIEIARFFLLECQINLRQRTVGYLRQSLEDLAEGNVQILEALRAAETLQAVGHAIGGTSTDAPATTRRALGLSPL